MRPMLKANAKETAYHAEWYLLEDAFNFAFVCDFVVGAYMCTHVTSVVPLNWLFPPQRRERERKKARSDRIRSIEIRLAFVRAEATSFPLAIGTPCKANFSSQQRASRTERITNENHGKSDDHSGILGKKIRSFSQHQPRGYESWNVVRRYHV
ncbi:hypothetical protein KM043_015378 [Ampulex compressa]|nr:hypothetical protein KM043_015378 [Ampulex compressa]